MKIKPILVILVLIGFESIAQDDAKLEFRVGAGIATAPDIINQISISVTESIVAPDFKDLDVNGGIALQGNLSFFPKSRLGLGLDLVYDRSDLRFDFENPVDPEQTTRVTYTSLMGRLDFRYIKKGPFRMYSSLGAGITRGVAERTDDPTIPKDEMTGWAFHVSPLGFRIGGALGIWAELGFGYRGLVSGGISYAW